MSKRYHVYITTSRKNTVLYTGVTGDLNQRIWMHKNGTGSKFVKKYNATKLVYMEEYSDPLEAIHREKCIKDWERAWKIEAIEKQNPNWQDLFDLEWQPDSGFRRNDALARNLEFLVIASHNDGKVREIGELLAPLGVEVVSAKELDLPEPEETEDTFAGNALLKARAAASASGLPALADDSGLAVKALSGAPGIYSARWAEKPDGSGRDFNMAMGRVWNELMPHTDKSAAFICALALVNEDEERVFEGRVEGDIVWPMRGEKGFGYDPIFVPKGYDVTFAQMEPTEKHAISHRARAFEKFLAALKS